MIFNKQRFETRNCAVLSLHRNRVKTRHKDKSGLTKLIFFFCVHLHLRGFCGSKNAINCLKLLCFDMNFLRTVTRFLILHTPYNTSSQKTTLICNCSFSLSILYPPMTSGCSTSFHFLNPQFLMKLADHNQHLMIHEQRN